MVRKKLAVEEKLSRVVSVKLTPPDHATWLAKVDASGLTSSEFFRKAVLTNRTQVNPVPKVDRSRLQLLSLYTGLAGSCEYLLSRAVLDRDRGLLTGTEYMALLGGLSSLLGAFREEVKRAG